MNEFWNNTSSSAGTPRRRSASRARSAASTTGDLSGARSRSNRGRGSAARTNGARPAASRTRASSRDAAAARGRSRAAGGAARSPRTSKRGNFMRYASDNRVVQTVYGITTGPYRFLFYGVVALAVLLSLYFPVRDLYIAHRTNEILQRQLEIRETYNDGLQKDVDKLLSTEGIEDEARSSLGLVMPDEKRLEVTGLDETKQGSSSSDTNDDAADKDAGDKDASDADDASAPDKDSDTDTADTADDDSASSDATPEDAAPSNSTEAEAAERAVTQDSPWYIQMLDALFFFDGVDGQRVASTGA